MRGGQVEPTQGPITEAKIPRGRRGGVEGLLPGAEWTALYSLWFLRVQLQLLMQFYILTAPYRRSLFPLHRDSLPGRKHTCFWNHIDQGWNVALLYQLWEPEQVVFFPLSLSFLICYKAAGLSPCRGLNGIMATLYWVFPAGPGAKHNLFINSLHPHHSPLRPCCPTELSARMKILWICAARYCRH